MRAGALTVLVTIKQLNSGVDALGQPVQTWTDVASVWANVLHLTGMESIKAGADTSAVKASIRIRHRTDVTAAMRIYLGSAAYEIKAVLPDEVARDRIDLACELINGGA